MPRSDAIEPERDDRLVGALIETGSRIGEPVAREGDPILDDVALARYRAGQHLRAGRNRPNRIGRRQHVEGQLGSTLQEFADAGRILHSRKLDEDAVGANPLDSRLGDAHLVDAAADDLDALLDRSVGAVADAVLAERHADVARRSGRHRNVGRGRAAKDDRGDRHGELLQEAHRLGLAGRIAQIDHDGIVVQAHRGRFDASLAQLAPSLAEEALQTLLHEGAHVDLEHEMRSAAKIQAERDLLFREPVRQNSELAGREKIGECRENAEQDDDGIGREHPTGGPHGCSFRANDRAPAPRGGPGGS